MLTRTAAGGLGVLVAGSVVFALALTPVITLSTDLIVSTAPAERAGAAAAMSETSIELGGALGIAVLGSIGTAVYRTGLADSMPSGVPSGAVDQARDTLGGAMKAAADLPARLAGPLLDAARGAFTDGMHVAVAVGALVTLVMSLVAGFALRDVRLDEPAAAEPEVSTSGSRCDPQPACVGAVGS